ncbi:MAG: efflux RND transporter periplasmic adaptor subunit, partial [Alphaproteobacteria bacterium]|nr:efflux RND transporter periplasmic adaptor subunit [Alphaproteobacteria bacterium]
KAVFGQVTSVDQTHARTRIAGTLREMSMDEGDLVSKGQVLAMVVDEKLQLQAVALDARLKSLNVRRTLARTNLDRAGELRKKGAVSQARLDEAQTALDVLRQEVAALTAERNLITQRTREGAVLAPTSGRILRVGKIAGSVVAPGEAVALIAANRYVLRLRLPERHARFVHVSDPVKVGARGVTAAPAADRTGRIRQIYPEIQDGRVVADVDVPGLGDFFVGERVRVWISSGKRWTYLVPKDYVGTRLGVSFIRLAKGGDVVVQTGPRRDDMVEILSGLRPGDRLVRP